MADEEEKDKNDNVDTNPDIAAEVEGMVDLSDVLATGDNETGAASAEDALQDHAEKESQEVDLFEKKQEVTNEADFVVKESKLLKLFNKLAPEGTYRRFIFSKVKNFFNKCFSTCKDLVLNFKSRSVQFVKEDSKVILKKNIEKIKTLTGKLVSEIKNFLSLSWKLKILFVFILLMVVTIPFVVQKALQGEILPELENPYVFNFNDVADKVFKIKENEPWEKFRNPNRYPEYVVRFDRIIVMLKPSVFSSKNTMGVFSLFYETSSQEAATEIKDREAEVRDITARTLEGVEYDEIRTAEGKKKAKKLVAQAINKFLNNGKVVKIYFKDFVVSP
ncbi:MAG: flagellar basal body-associated FliL family protein [Bdellovibrionota bacterium]|nr:flagellar basal body-associated FliL family protein [Bdellovibrionota bacterium]